MYLTDGSGDFAYHARSLEFSRGVLRRAGKHGGYAGGQQRTGGGSGGGAFDDETNYFRITRTGPKTKFAASADGRSWHEFTGPNVAYPDKVTLGLYVANPQRGVITAEFDEFTVTPLTPK
jgi:hypothetical protein